MANYTSPDVYIETVPSGSQTISSKSSSIGAMIGVTRSGEVGKAQLVTSWTDFVSKFANGLESPFLATSYLPYAVYGFFANGGSMLYVGRVASKTAAKATKTGTNLKVTAISEGTWGNDIKISIAKSKDYVEPKQDAEPAEAGNLEFDVTISLGSSDSAKVEGVFFDTIADAILTNEKAKKWLSDVEVVAPSALSEEDITLAGGADGTSDLADADYVDGLTMLDEYLDDITMVAIPGVETIATRDGVMTYCANNKLFPIISMPVASTDDEIRVYRKGHSCDYGALVVPWGNVTDALTNKEKPVPPEGHYMGVCSRIIESRGAFKAPAGTEAVVRGFNSMERNISKEINGILNPLGVICIMNRPNYGLCVWGARGLNSADTKMRYVSDHLLNIKIRKELYAGTMFAEFEPNDETLQKRCYTTCKNYLEKLRKDGALKGQGEGTAWYCICDSTNNTDDTIAEGYLYIDIGYAPVKPTEFVVIRLAHSIDSAE